MSLTDFITKYGGWTEEYKFYNDTATLRYDPKKHVYYLVTPDGLEVLEGVTSVCHIIDKSEALIPWACKMMAQKLLATVRTMKLWRGQMLDALSLDDFTKLVNEAKGAHKEKLEDAGAVGHAAHAWIEEYIKARIAGDKGREEVLLATFPLDERATRCCEAALEWMHNHNVRWRFTERKIFSREHKFAGTMDGLCVVDSCSDPLCCPNPFQDRLTIADWKTSNYLYMEYLLQTAAYTYAYMEETGEEVEDRWIIRLGKDDGEFDPWHAEGSQRFQDDWDGFKLALNLTRRVAFIKDRIKADEARFRAARRVQKQAEREAALEKRCKGADKYKGVRAPKCNGGNPCEACREKFQQAQSARLGHNGTTSAE